MNTSKPIRPSILGGRAKHFGELLNQPPAAEPAEIEPTENPLEMDPSKPTRPDIKKAITHMKGG